MPRIREDPTIYVGMRLFNGTDHDTLIERVEYGGFGVIAFGSNRLHDGEMTVYKTLRRELLDIPQTRAGFVRECLLWMGLWPHPNVGVATAVLEMGDETGLRPFLALTYAERGSLRTLLEASQRQSGGRLPPEAAFLLAQQIAAGLAYLHHPDPTYLRNKPTVHRDLKPENVLVMGNGRAVITDFGLAKAVEESATALALLLAESGWYGPGGQPGQIGRQAEEAILIGGEAATQTTGLHTARGAALGTLAYMAPEQWEDARFASTPADIYALGVMLSEILAGRHALLDLDTPHTQAEWRRAHQQPHPRSLREVAPEMPEVVEAIYQRCLARSPEDRPTADEVVAALGAGARATGYEAYVAPEFVSHTSYNEWVHWHQWGNAYTYFEMFSDALARNDRELPIARQLRAESPSALPATLLTRGNILKGMGAQALAEGHDAQARALDQQVEAAYQESLSTFPPATTPEGSRGRSFVWKQLGVFNAERKRYPYADDAYQRALNLEPDMADAYYNRAINRIRWARAEAQIGHLDAAIRLLRQARVDAVTALGMRLPPAQGLLQDVEQALRQLGVTG